MVSFEDNLKRLRAEYGTAGGGAVRDPEFRKVVDRLFDPSGTRKPPYAGIPSLLAAPIRPVDWSAPDFGDLQVALLGVPMWYFLHHIQAVVDVVRQILFA